MLGEGEKKKHAAQLFSETVVLYVCVSNNDFV